MSLNLTRTKTPSLATLSSRFFNNKPTQPWTRPNDWIALPTLQPTDNRFVGLLAVTNDSSNLAAVTCTTSTGTFTVDWGDGSSPQTYTSGTNATYQYTYSGVNSPITSNGWKQVVVKVYPTTGGATLNTFSLNVIPTGYSTATGAISIPWLDISIAGQSLTSIILLSDITSSITNNVYLNELQQITIVSLSSSYSSLAYFCYQLSNLRSFSCYDPLRACTDFTGMFFSCHTLPTVSLFNTSAGTSFSNMFNGCYSLTTVPLFNLSAGTSFSNMFNNCYSLTTVPAFNMSSGTSFNLMFNNCYSLVSIPAFTIGSGPNINFASMFAFCYSLTNVSLFNTSAGTSFSNMFNGCYSLTTVPLFNLSAGITFTSMFNNCYSLVSVPAFNMSSGTSFSSMFVNCRSLVSVPAFIIGSGPNINFTSMFNSCYSLTTVPLFNLSAGITFTSMFGSCYSLTTVPAFDVSSGTTFTTMFAGCRSLASVAISGCKYGITYATAPKLARAELVAIFNALGTAVGAQVITISNCYGAASLTSGERAIATGKGWTITG